jgi:predicted TPR repeat methyltransferase
VELNPDYTAAWRWLGEAWEKAGVLKEAAAAYRTGIRSAVNSADLEASMEIEKSLSRLPAEFQEP